jgi:hypothetical protein
MRPCNSVWIGCPLVIYVNLFMLIELSQLMDLNLFNTSLKWTSQTDGIVVTLFKIKVSYKQSQLYVTSLNDGWLQLFRSWTHSDPRK